MALNSQAYYEDIVDLLHQTLLRQFDNEEGRTMILQEAYLAIASKLPTDPAVKVRLDRGYDIVRELDRNGYNIIKVRTIGQYVYHVSKLSTSLIEDSSKRYVVDDVKKTCTCPDFETARGGLCKHRFAIMLMREMED